MGNPFQDQLLKAGVVTKQQVKKAQSASNKKKKEQRSKKSKPVVDEAKLKAQQAAKEKSENDKQLNLRKQEQAKQKATSSEIDQLIKTNLIKRSDDFDIIYNFEHRKKVNRIYVDNELKKKIINGTLGIARIEGRYELVPKDVAIKIQQRNDKRIVLFEVEETVVDENDPYAEFQVPDDLVW